MTRDEEKKRCISWNVKSRFGNDLFAVVGAKLPPTTGQFSGQLEMAKAAPPIPSPPPPPSPAKNFQVFFNEDGAGAQTTLSRRLLHFGT